MKNTWEILKKLGAGIIVLLLIIMMAITFSSQPMDEIIALLSGSSKAGTFNDEPILIKDYSFVYNECENQFQRYGLTEIPPYLMQNCIFENIQSLYVKPVIANDLGLDISKESIEKQIIDYVTEVHRIQQKNNLPEDVIPIDELYQRELRAFPISKRIAFLKANLVDQFLLKPVPLSNSDWEIIQTIAKDNIEISLEMIVFTNQDLLNQIQVDVTDEEIRKKYEEDKTNFLKENKDKEYPSLEKRYKFIKENIQKEKKRTELSKIKDQLSKLNQKGTLSLEEIEKIVNVKAIQKNISIKTIDSFVVNNKKINLLHNEFILALINLNGNKKNIIGPIQDKENTIYLKINQVFLKNYNKKIDIKKETIEERLAYVFYNYILEQYRKRGNFQLYDLTNSKKNQN
ncbi:MAG: hypothetical protein KatS3mg129_1995 [Leptospiraceae bacterium]|nr:MAG: hypothetical protein KatS3mg129_1995 [Leptospiraceae bacterium]